MNDKDIIRAGIQKAIKSNQFWLEQTKFLVKGKANHTVQQPASHSDCEFGMWLCSEGMSLNTIALYAEVELLHQEFHQIYEAIYKGAEHVYDSESHDAIKRSCAKLESHASLIIYNLEKIQELLENPDMAKNVQNKLNTAEVEEKPPESDAVVPIQLPGDSSVELRRQLKEQDLFQLKQEQQLTELELKQLEDRQQLTVQGVKQVTQYQALKEQEIDHQLSDHKVLEENNINAIYLGQQDLNRIKEEIISKTDELGQLVLVDQKLDKRKSEEEGKEKKILADFDKSQSVDKQDIAQLETQRAQWEKEAKNLKKQLVLIEQDLEKLTRKQKTKQLIIDQSNEKKEIQLQELAQHSQLQVKLNGHKIKVKEGKEQELDQLEQERSTRQEKLRVLEVESANLENQKVDINKSHKKELRKLDEQQRFKKMTIDKLESDKGRKKQELKEIVHQQEAIQESLDKIDLMKASEEKVLEEV